MSSVKWIRNGLGIIPKDSFKCRWADCEVDLTNLKQSFCRHICQNHINGPEPSRACEWKSCPERGPNFESQTALMLHIQSEHTKEKYLRCLQPGCNSYFQRNAALDRHLLRDHNRSLSSMGALILRIAVSFIAEKLFSIFPRSPGPGKAKHFAYAQPTDLTGKIRKECLVGGGSFADVHMGYWDTGTTSTKVAIKVFRSHLYNQEDIPKLEERLRREAHIWEDLDHPNIVPLFGVTSDFGKSSAIVCQWMDQGTLSNYLEKEKDYLNLRRRLSICISVADGLAYLHSRKVIHGDLRPANILMENDTAHLSDFGLSNVIADFQGPSFLTSMGGGSVRWIAPELLQASDITTLEHSMSRDVYSFASVAFHVITGLLPYWNIRHTHAVVAAILMSPSKFPSRPEQSVLTDACWDILTMCWAVDPTKRPDIKDVMHRLQELPS